MKELSKNQITEFLKEALIQLREKKDLILPDESVMKNTGDFKHDVQVLKYHMNNMFPKNKEIIDFLLMGIISQSLLFDGYGEFNPFIPHPEITPSEKPSTHTVSDIPTEVVEEKVEEVQHTTTPHISDIDGYEWEHIFNNIKEENNSPRDLIVTEIMNFCIKQNLTFELIGRTEVHGVGVVLCEAGIFNMVVADRYLAILFNNKKITEVKSRRDLHAETGRVLLSSL